MLDCYKAQVIAKLSEAYRARDTEKWKQAEDNAWSALYMMNTLEFHLHPDKSKIIYPARHAVEMFLYTIQQRKAIDFTSKLSDAFKEAVQKVDKMKEEK
jgi:hypothetical protein